MLDYALRSYSQIPRLGKEATGRTVAATGYPGEVHLDSLFALVSATNDRIDMGGIAGAGTGAAAAAGQATSDAWRERDGPTGTH